MREVRATVLNCNRAHPLLLPESQHNGDASLHQMTPACHRAIGFLIRAFLLLLLVGGSHLSEPAWAQSQPTTAFVNVNVVPMDTEQVLKNQTVIVEADGHD